MTITKARQIALGRARLMAAVAQQDALEMRKAFPGKSKPMSKATARLWQGATVTFR